MKGSVPKYCAYDKGRLCNENCSAHNPVEVPEHCRDKGEAYYCGRGNFTIWILYEEIQSE